MRLAVLGLRDLYANLLASSVVKQSKIVDIRRLYEPTLKFEGTRGYLHTIEHRWLERIAGACSLGPYAVLLARPLKEHFVRKTRLVWSAVAAAARARRSGELEQPLGCWKGGQRTPLRSVVDGRAPLPALGWCACGRPRTDVKLRSRARRDAAVERTRRASTLREHAARAGL